ADDVRNLLVHAETEHRLGAVLADHALRQQQVRQIGVADFVEQLILFHGESPFAREAVTASYPLKYLPAPAGVCRLVTTRAHSRPVTKKLESGFRPFIS